MKTIVRCLKCRADDEAALLEIGNENLHKVKCDKGHESFLVITQQKHEVLFEVGNYAIVDGYYREAISSFSASLERYYEFFIKVLSVGLSSSEFQKVWKQVASQSERQLGGYMFTYLNVFRSSPEILPQSLVKLRNSVIHKGHIPTRDEAAKFGKAAAKIINDGCNLLHGTKKGQLEEIIGQAICPNNSSNYPTLILHTYLNCLSETELSSFEHHLDSLQTHNKPRFET